MSHLLTVSILEFKKNPGKVMVKAKGRPVAVLKGNRPAFYVVSPKLMTHISELNDECRLPTLVESRLKSLDHAVKVNLNDL